jgi:nucleotide-binding universal stress UspA family protein
MYRSVLVPLDGSTFGEQALPLALSIARRAGVGVQLVHVLSPLAAAYAEVPFFFDNELDEQIKARQLGYLEGLGMRLRSYSPVPVTAHLLEGEIVTTLTDHAARSGADLVVMTTHARGPLGRFWLGSVADELIRHLPVPLLLVRPHEGSPDFTSHPVLKHLLVPLDGTPLAEQILGPALELGRLMEADYTLFRVIRPVLPAHYTPEGASMGEKARALLDKTQALHKQLRQEARSYLEQVAERLADEGCQVETRVAVEEQPGVAILHEARPPAINAVALETHGRRGLSRLMLGSVADKVIRGATVPVLVHRPSHP